MGGDVDLVDAILVGLAPLGYGVPDPRQDFDLGQPGHSETAPVQGRPFRPEGLLARPVELISEDMRIARLGSEQKGTEDP